MKNTRTPIPRTPVRRRTRRVKVAVPSANGVAADVMNRVKDFTAEARQAAHDQVEEVRDKAAAYAKTGRKKLNRWERDLEHRIEDKPVLSILAAAAAGLLLGFMIPRR